MFSWIARVLPSLGPAFTAFLNPWVLVAVLVYGGGMMFYGIHLEHGRLEAFEAKVAAAGEAQTARAVQKAKDDKSLKEATDNAYKTHLAAIAADNTALVTELLHDPRRSFVSTGQQPVGSKCPDGQTCFDAAEFDTALRGFAADAAGFVGEGEALKLDLDTARTWTATERARAQEKR